MRLKRLLIAALLAAGGGSGIAAPPRLTIWDLPLGSPAATLPPFAHLACGSDGGPPLVPLETWTAFASCAAEPDGLHEVYFEYDTTAESAAPAAGRYLDPALVGTGEAYFPIVASALFDDGGTLRGIRIVTDPRPELRKRSTPYELRPRGEHYLLGLYLMGRFGMTEANCRDLAPAPGESPVIGMFTKRNCERIVDGRRYRIEQRYLRKPGQHDIDPDTGGLTKGEFESYTRAEVRLAGN